MSELDLNPGQMVGGYTLISRLGAGAMGSVWRVRDDGGQIFAMKILRDSLSDDNVEQLDPSDPSARERLTARERLRREAMALRKVQHPGVCDIVDMELDDTLAFIVTELIEGKNLRDDVAANGRYIADDLERLTRKLIEAVRAVHAAGIVHRDIKPTNVMISASGPVLVDFGIAMGEGESHVTRTGMVMGTPGFIAPEIIDGAESDEETDWWSLAAVLGFAATGAPVFGTKPMMAVLERAAAGNANLTGLPADTMAAFRSALNPNRSQRCTPEQLLQAIQIDALNSTVWDDTSDHDTGSGVVLPFDGSGRPRRASNSFSVSTAAKAVSGAALAGVANAMGAASMGMAEAAATASVDNPRIMWRNEPQTDLPSAHLGNATDSFDAPGGGIKIPNPLGRTPTIPAPSGSGERLGQLQDAPTTYMSSQDAQPSLSAHTAVMPMVDDATPRSVSSNRHRSGDASDVNGVCSTGDFNTGEPPATIAMPSSSAATFGETVAIPDTVSASPEATSVMPSSMAQAFDDSSPQATTAMPVDTQADYAPRSASSTTSAATSSSPPPSDMPPSVPPQSSVPPEPSASEQSDVPAHDGIPPMPNVDLTGVKRHTYYSRGLTPCLLLAVPIGLLSASMPLIAHIVAFVVLWIILTAGLNTESQLQREGKHGGKRGSDALWRTASLPWHMIKAFVLTIPRIATAFLVFASGAALAIPVAQLQVAQYLLPIGDSGFSVTLPTGLPTSPTGLTLMLFGAGGWLIAAVLISPEPARIGASALCGLGHLDATAFGMIPAYGYAPNGMPCMPNIEAATNRSSRLSWLTIAMSVLWILFTLVTLVQFIGDSFIDWSPLVLYSYY